MAGLAGIATLAFAQASLATHMPSDAEGHTTLEQRIVGGNRAGGAFSPLARAGGEPHVLRALPGASVQPGRAGQRTSLAYFAQMTDLQLADEESPARVEFLDEAVSNSAWRPQEAFNPFAIDYAIRQINHYVPASPVTHLGSRRAPMGFAVLTGDLSDNQQRNETQWVQKLIEGGTPLDPNSGVPIESLPPDYRHCSEVDKTLLAGSDEHARYTGVQDYSDMGARAPDYYDPNDPHGLFKQWPSYPGLMDRAQQPFVPQGLQVPSYVANGNHDGLAQGNEDAIRAYEDIAMGCRKVHTPADPRNFSAEDVPEPPDAGAAPDPTALLGGHAGAMLVPPDPERQFVDKRQIKEVYGQGRQSDNHGFTFVDPEEEKASDGSAAYYSWDPVPGLRFISIDTLSEGGVVGASAEGNIDEPQWQWLERELKRATDEDKPVVVVGHHPIRSLTADVPDEAAAPCTPGTGLDEPVEAPDLSDDGHGHDHNPGCDIDPRLSTPIHLGKDRAGVEGLQSLLDRHPHAIAYVAGHTHENRVLARGETDPEADTGTWWEVNTAAEADWPMQNRLIEAMDNRDGTLSIFGTLVDSAAPAGVPADGTPGAAFSNAALAAVARAFTYNDPRRPDGDGEGAAKDRNVELLVRDPRRNPPPGVGPAGTGPSGGPQHAPQEAGGGDGQAKPLALRFRSARVQDVLRRRGVVLSLRCPATACQVTIRGTVAGLEPAKARKGASKKRKRRAKVLRLRTVKRSLPAGVTRKVRVPLNRKARRIVRRALRRGAKPRIVLRVAARDRAGGKAQRTYRVRVKPLRRRR